MKDRLLEALHKYKYVIWGIGGSIVIVLLVVVIILSKNNGDNQNESTKKKVEESENSCVTTTLFETKESTTKEETTEIEEVTEETVETTKEDIEETTTYVYETTNVTTVPQTTKQSTTSAQTTTHPTTDEVLEDTTTSKPLRGKDGVILEELTITRRKAGDNQWIDYTEPVPKTYSEYKERYPEYVGYRLCYDPPFSVSKNPVVEELYFEESVPDDVKNIYGTPLIEGRNPSNNIIYNIDMDCILMGTYMIRFILYLYLIQIIF